MTTYVVGAGISGAACARELVLAGRQVQVLDRGRVPGGRMASRTVAGRVADTGASYFVARDPGFVAVVDDWVERGLARPWTDTFHTATPAQGLTGTKTGPVRYAAPGGLRSLVADLLDGTPVMQEHTVAHVAPGLVDGASADAVVLAMPDPQALRLLDPAHPAAAAAADREWLPTLALVAVYNARSWEPTFDGAFVSGSQVLEWVADDGRRRGDGAPVLVAHSTPDFARTAGDDAAEVMARELALVMGERIEPVETYLQRWGLAKPAAGRDEPYFLEDGIGLCGDGWGASKVEAAWLSGRALGQALVG